MRIETTLDNSSMKDALRDHVSGQLLEDTRGRPGGLRGPSRMPCCPLPHSALPTPGVLPELPAGVGTTFSPPSVMF